MTINRSTYIVGDVRDCLAATPDGSVDLVMTSPPFLALRSYLPADHPDKHREIGAEPDPATFLDTLLLLTAEWGRVLAPHGSICVELGDTYAGAGGGSGWPLPKSLCGIPHLYHLSLAYGRNLLTGEESPAGRWRVRNVVAWCRPNPPVGALGDKFRPATSYMTVATRAQKRYFDLDAVRTEHKTADAITRPRAVYKRGDSDDGVSTNSGGNPAGGPPLDYWVIPTAPYSGSHYAVYPPALVERPIKSMVPHKVCTVCGEPSRRGQRTYEPDGSGGGASTKRDAREPEGNSRGINGGPRMKVVPSDSWSDCGHDSWRTGVVLDPFAGSGTTLMVANELERDAVGFDLDARNATLARQRVDKFMFADFEVYPLSLLGFLAPQIRM